MAYRNNAGGGGYGGGQQRDGGYQQRPYQPREGGGDRGGRGGGRGGRGGGGGGHGSAREPAQAPQMDNRRERTKIRDDMEQYFKDHDIPEGNPILDEKMPPGQIQKSSEQYHTNCFGVKVDKFPLFQYHVEMQGVKSGRAKKALLFTKTSNDDYVATDRKTRCRDIFDVIKQIRRDIFDPSISFYYDLQATLMTTAQLKSETADGCIKINFDPHQFARYPSIQSFIEINVVIKQSETENQLTSDDMSMCRIDDLTKFDRAHQRFIELATSQFALFTPNEVVCLAGGKMYLVTPEKSMEKNVVDRCNKFSADKFLGIGCKKSAKYIEGPLGRTHENIGLFISPLKTPFYRQQTLLAFLQGLRFDVTNQRTYRAMASKIQGLYIFNPKLAAKKTWQVTGLARDSARSFRFTLQDGQNVNVEQYFREKYNVKLQYPDLPLVKGKGKTDLLPMEVALIDDNQPAPKNRMSQFEDAEMVKIAAQPPVVQRNEVRGFLGALGLNKLTLEHDGIVMRNHLTVVGRTLEKPEIVYANDKTANPGTDGLWNIAKTFLRPGKTEKWGLIRYGTIQVNMREFQNAFCNFCKKNGIQMPDKPALIGAVDPQNRPLESFFVEGKKVGIDFLMVITDLQIDMQGELKMLERKHEIATQNVTSKVANDAAGRGTATMENIVNKTNLKLGGINYTIKHNQKCVDDAFGKNCLIIGVALSHAGSIDDVQRARGGTAASTTFSSVGYSANTGVDPYEFVGDHLPNNPHRSEILDLIPGIIRSCLIKYHENKKVHPSTMLIYLNGSSEGDFVLLKRFEIPLVRRVMDKEMGREIPLTVIVPQRSNVARIYKTNPDAADKPAAQNVRPGVVIDTGLVHPKFNEFFLNAHTTIQGTCRTPKYTLLHNDNINVGMDALQHLTYYLCYGHQIVNSPTSLPSPVYVAMAYAERGTKVFKRVGESQPSITPEELVEHWSYETTEAFRNKRINA